MSIIGELLAAAVEQGASDIHLKAGQAPYFRIHGSLTNSGYETIDAAGMHAIADDLVPPYQEEIYAETHEADFALQEEGVGRFRVSLFHSQGSPAVVMRHVKSVVPNFDDLGLPEHIKGMAYAHRGIILVCGTTGSGKSSTLAALINEMNLNLKRRIITIEDPVEYLFEDNLCIISQREIGLDTPNFQTALRMAMRQDPDVILVGEMRDTVSLLAALQASETGHLVMSTLHSSTASQTIHRILDFFPAEEQTAVRMSLASNLHAILCQRLMPGRDGGVVPTVEIMINTPAVRKLLQKDQLEVLGKAVETGEADGMQSFNKSIYDLIKAGKVTESAGMDSATNPEQLKMMLQGIFLSEGSSILGS